MTTQLVSKIFHFIAVPFEVSLDWFNHQYNKMKATEVNQQISRMCFYGLIFLFLQWGGVNNSKRILFFVFC